MTAPIRILLLEDDPSDARLVGHMLRRLKEPAFAVYAVDRLAQAIDRIKRHPEDVDVVLADLSVPDSTGIATLDRLTEAAPSLPVVVLTGIDDDDLALEALKHGAQDYVVKGSGDGAMLARIIRYAIERKVGEQALKEALDKAEQAARAKSLFLAMIGHEIRTPLNGILGMARLLAETRLDNRQRVFAETVASSGELLLGLVNDILDFARLDVDALVLDCTTFDVRNTVEEVRLVLASRAAEKGLILCCRFAADIAEVVTGDNLRLRQILLNLVGNAIKFTDKGSITIAVTPVPGEDEVQHLRISITDTGIGIAEEARGNLFAEFWQGDSGVSRRYAGAGLGLAICKRLVTLMGGSIGYDSEPGRGTTFRVDLPLPISHEPLPQPDEEAQPTSPPRRVLLVDDNEVNLEVAACLLEGRGHHVVSAADGYQAVAAAKEGGFDMVLLDMRMPGMDGVETAEAIRAMPGELGTVPIYLLTANPLREDEQRWRAAGIEACLTKPFRVDDVNRLLAGIGTRGAVANDVPALQSDNVQSLPPLVNLEDLGEDVQGLGHDRMKGLAALFHRSSSADLACAVQHASAGSFVELGQVVHRMAGAAISMHLTRLIGFCRTLENLARKEDPQALEQMQELQSLWDDSLAALDAAFEAQEAG